MGHGSLGLSCVFVQGLLLSGYAYRVAALWAIPSAPLQAEDHLRIAHAVAEAEPIEVLFDVFSTDRHSIILQSAASRARAILSNASAIRSITSGSFIQSPTPC